MKVEDGHEVADTRPKVYIQVTMADLNIAQINLPTRQTDLHIRQANVGRLT